jgi:hypothetical protein
MYFDSEEDMMNYVSGPDYETADMPGLCFGISHYSSEDGNSHTFKFHFID